MDDFDYPAVRARQLGGEARQLAVMWAPGWGGGAGARRSRPQRACNDARRFCSQHSRCTSQCACSPLPHSPRPQDEDERRSASPREERSAAEAPESPSASGGDAFAYGGAGAASGGGSGGAARRSAGAGVGGAQGQQGVGLYDPAEFEHLNVTEDIKVCTCTSA